jgi:hypothetical protein
MDGFGLKMKFRELFVSWEMNMTLKTKLKDQIG